MSKEKFYFIVWTWTPEATFHGKWLNTITFSIKLPGLRPMRKEWATIMRYAQFLANLDT
jgi:hypothetical protein